VLSGLLPETKTDLSGVDPQRIEDCLCLFSNHDMCVDSCCICPAYIIMPLTAMHYRLFP